MKNDKKMKLNVKTAANATVGDPIYTIINAAVVPGSNVQKFDVVRDVIRNMDGVDEDLTEILINKKIRVRRNGSFGRKNINDVFFNEEDALEVINSAYDESLKEAEENLARSQKEVDLMKEYKGFFEGKDKLDFDKPGRIIDVKVNIKAE